MRRAYVIFAIAVSIASLIAGWFIAGARESRTTAAPTESADVTTAPESAGSTAAETPSDTSSEETAAQPASPASTSSSAAAVGDVSGLLAAVNTDGDVVLVDPETAATVRTLVPRGGAPAISVAWDATRQVVYFGRGGPCASVWRYRLGYEPVEQIAQGHHPVISPDGTKVAIANGCNPGSQSDGITVRDVISGAPVLALPMTTPADKKYVGPWYAGDLDWRPDSAALVVTVGWEGSDTQRLIDLRKPPRSVLAGAGVPVRNTYPETTYQQVEYVGQRLVIAAFCCTGNVETPSARIVTRDGKTGTLTSIATVPAYSLTADQKGRLRYLDADPTEKPAGLWALDRLDGQPRRIGGLFRALSW